MFFFATGFLENGTVKRSVLTFSERFRKESFFGRYVDAKNGVQRVQCSFSMSVVATYLRRNFLCENALKTLGRTV